MENITIHFNGESTSDTPSHVVAGIHKNGILIQVEHVFSGTWNNVVLDKKTAIKFVKHIKRIISELEVDNV